MRKVVGKNPTIFPTSFSDGSPRREGDHLRLEVVAELVDHPPVVVAPHEAAHDLELEPGADGEAVEDGGVPRHAAPGEARAADAPKFARLDGALQHLHCPFGLLSYHCTDEMEAEMDEQTAEPPHHNSFAWQSSFSG